MKKNESVKDDDIPVAPKILKWVSISIGIVAVIGAASILLIIVLSKTH